LYRKAAHPVRTGCVKDTMTMGAIEQGRGWLPMLALGVVHVSRPKPAAD
jgi:hypothetical protein